MSMSGSYSTAFSTAAAPGPTGPFRAVTVPEVAEWLRLPDGVDVDVLQNACDATSVWVNRLPCVVDGLATDDDWTADIRLGAVMLAARLYRRRNSPSGIDTITDAGAVYLPRRDADVDTLLRLNEYNPPATA